jgi:pimeloyl-ACP methyl ester carboxylesterase
VYVLAATDSRKESAYICFAGSVSDKNWRKNIDFVSAPFEQRPRLDAAIRGHKGFIESYAAVSTELEGIFAALPASVSVVHISGHSLGGALAQLCTVHASQFFAPRDRDPGAAPSRAVRLRTLLFASPPAGDALFQSEFRSANDSAYITFVTPFDVIPAIANTTFPNLGQQRVVIPATSNILFRSTHSMREAYLPAIERAGGEGIPAVKSALHILESAPFVMFAVLMFYMYVRLLIMARNVLVPNRSNKLRKLLSVKSVLVILLGAGGGGAAFGNVLSNVANLSWVAVLSLCALSIAVLLLARFILASGRQGALPLHPGPPRRPGGRTRP